MKGYPLASSSPADARKVFVIHGRNEPARKAMFEFLRSLGLQPIEWAHAIDMTGQGSPYIGDVLDAAFGAAQAVVVLQTPDDVAYLHESLAGASDPECQPQMQPRPNVLFEAGMAMGRDPGRTIIVELGTVKSFSDIHGRHVVRLDNSIGKRQSLAQRLEATGCAVDRSGTDWHSAGDLAPPVAPQAPNTVANESRSWSTSDTPGSRGSPDITPWGAEIKRRRYELGLTQGQVARILGISQSTLNRWESGASVPKASLQQQVVEFLDSDESEWSGSPT